MKAIEAEELSLDDFFNEIYQEMYYEIYYLAKRVLENKDNLEEFLEDIFLEIYNNIEMIREEKNHRKRIYITVLNKGKKSNHQ